MINKHALLIPSSDKKFYSQKFTSQYSQFVDEEETGPSDTNVSSTCRTGDYFHQVDQENAAFSHNAMIMKQLEFMKQQNEFYLVLDESLNLTNVQDFNQLNNDQYFSVLLNIRFKKNSNKNQTGLWLGRSNAILPDNSVVLFAQCIIQDKINDKSINLLTLSLLIADMVFFLSNQQEEFNIIISYFRMVYHYAQIPKEKELFLYDQFQPSSTTVKELQKYFNQIMKINKFPRNPNELDELFFAEDINKLFYLHPPLLQRFPIQIKQVFGQMIPLKTLQYIVIQAASNIQRHMKTQDINEMQSPKKLELKSYLADK